LTEGSFAPGDLLSRFIRRWPVFIALTVAGGLLGWGTTYLRAPQYQAGAVLDVGFDYSLTVPLTRSEEGYVRERVRSLLVSDAVLDDAISRVNDDLLTYEEIGVPDRLRDHIQLVERRTAWTFLATANSPKAAAAIADAWATASKQALEEAVSHAWRAAELQTAFFNLGCKLTEAEDVPGTAVWDCEADRGQTEPEDLAEAVRREVELTHGIIPALSVVRLNEAPLPERPILWGRGALILAGLLLGSLAGIVVVLRREPCCG
jgi:uncharacterized protein involved in exopolysaccharide biosynthesis